jgi:hypothetical protein
MIYRVWFLDWRANRKGERLGQAFCNDFIKGSWTELYYEEEEHIAEELIVDYLVTLCYYPETPSKI